jgi:kinesin family member 12
MQNHERNRQDECVVTCESATSLVLSLPEQKNKQFTFNAVLNENTRQMDVF